MKIEIDVSNEPLALLRIDGQEMTVSMGPGFAQLDNCPPDKNENIIGCMVAGEIYQLVDKIHRGISAAHEQEDKAPKTWQPMEEDAAEVAYEAIVIGV